MADLTAMQELIEYLENNCLIDKKVLINKCKALEQKEKKQITNAWIHGELRVPLDMKHINNEEEYYKQTFKS